MRKQRGLTLLEILIGVSIFATALTLASGVFSQTMKYQKKAEVSRQINYEARSGLENIISDIRNSQGVALTRSGSNYHNFAIFYNTGNNLVDSPADTYGNMIRVRISDRHLREYRYDSFDKALRQRDYVDGSWSNYVRLTSDDIEIDDFEIRANLAKSPTNNLDNNIKNSTYPWLELDMSIKYQDPKDRSELRNEKVEISTVVTPRDFNFLD
jgi:prepilin-type N-terminal cleavage/methylation domain-containing protein